MLLKDSYEIEDIKNIQSLDFFLSIHDTKYPIFTIAIYENCNQIFLLNSKIMPWYMNNIFYDNFIRDQKHTHYRFNNSNTLETYYERKQEILQNYRVYNTNLIDILYYLLQVNHKFNDYNFYIECPYKKYYLELYSYVINHNSYAPLWLYDINFIHHLTGQRSNLTQDNLRNCLLARKMRNFIRQDVTNITTEQINYLNTFAELDRADIINVNWFKWLW